MEGTPITTEELESLVGTTITINGVLLGTGMDMVALGTEDGRTIIIAPCYVCGGEGAHLNIITLNDGDDAGAA